MWNPVKCGKCQTPVLPAEVSGGQFELCPGCREPLAVEIFPAILKTPTASVAQPALIEGESTCFYHADKMAAIVCQSCGRFLCGLCDLELNGRHLCPNCLESGQKKSKFKDLENSRVLWDNLALTVAVVPLILVWPSLIGAPITLYLVWRHRNDPCSITGKSNAALVAAVIVAVLEIAGWALLIAQWI